MFTFVTTHNYVLSTKESDHFKRHNKKEPPLRRGQPRQEDLETVNFTFAQHAGNLRTVLAAYGKLLGTQLLDFDAILRSVAVNRDRDLGKYNVIAALLP